MRKIILIVILCSFSMAVLAQNLLVELEGAYQQKSLTALKIILSNWQAQSIPINDAEFNKLTPIEKEGYQLFKAFYQPNNLAIYKGFGLDSSLYQKTDFLLVQNNISLVEVEKVYYKDEDVRAYLKQKILSWKSDYQDKLLKGLADAPSPLYRNPFYEEWMSGDTSGIIRKLEIENFRPQLNIETKHLLFLDKQKDGYITSFLKNDNPKLARGGIMTENKDSGDTENRKAFLENYVKIFGSRMRGYFNLLSFPAVHLISINKEMNTAKIDFRMHLSGGYAILIKVNGEWVMKDAHQTSVE